MYPVVVSKVMPGDLSGQVERQRLSVMPLQGNELLHMCLRYSIVNNILADVGK